jgi:Ca-activated chloride channel family protein
MWQALADFHFLRPAWLLALLPCALLALWLRRNAAQGSLWHTLIDPALLDALLLRDAPRRQGALPLLLLAGWTIATIALAGPAWERLPQPVNRANDALVIALDLGSTMRAADVQPSRYERARFKLADLLARRRDGQTALIVYAGDAHVVTPLSDDAGTLAAMLPALSPEIMPVEGDDLPGAVRLAGSLLAGAGVPRGRLLVITDRFPADRHAEVSELLDQGGLSLSLLATGTARGAPVTLPGGGFLRNESGGIVVPGLDIDTMREGVAAAGGRFATLALDDSDLDYLLPPPVVAEIAPGSGGTRTFDQWQDRAPWLALALLPLAALAFRRGWLLGVALALLLPLPRAEAMEWQDLWLRKDQQAARALAAGDARRAAELFRSPDWRGAAQYEAGDYEGAARSWATQDDAAAHYNRGNALARAGHLQEALSAYDAAIARKPGMEDAVENRRLVEEQLRKQREQQAQQDAQPSGGDQRDEQRGEQQSQAGARQPGEGSQDSREGATPGGEPDGQQADDGSPGQDPSGAGAGQDDGERGAAGMDARESASGKEGPREERGAGLRSGSADAQAADAAQGAATAGSAEDSAEEREQRAAMEQWLRQVPDDPGELLRRKFDYEYRARRGGATEENGP